MPEDLRRPIGLRRLAVVGSVGLFALAVFQAQPGCGGAEAEPSAPVMAAPESEHEPPAATPASEPAASEPAVVEPTAVAEPAPATPAPATDEPTPANHAIEAESHVFMGASKSGFVMTPPRARQNAARPQAEVQQQAPQQQNPAPGS